MEFILTLIIFLIAIPIGEYFGRSKHIGKWWTVTLMTCGIIPGIIALIFSPKATKEPTKGKVYENIGWVIVLLIGILGIILTFFDLMHVMERYSGSLPNYITQSFGFRFMFGIWAVIIGVYLVKLGSGEIVNYNPKFFVNPNNSSMQNTIKIITSENQTISTKNPKFYILRNNQPLGPYTIAELESMQIKEEELVCLNGSQEWINAGLISALEHIIIYNPPPLPVEEEEEEEEEEEGEEKQKVVLRKLKGPYMMPMKISDELAEIVGKKPLPRTEVVKALWAYIKKNKLQDPKEKRNINADAKLQIVFGGKKTVSMFEMTKLVSKHLSTAPKASINEIDNEIIDDFNQFATWAEKYQYIIEISQVVRSTSFFLKRNKNKIINCQSDVWLTANELNGLIYYDAVSDSDFLNGVITLLMTILSKDTSDNIINAELKFIDQIGLRSYSDQKHLHDIEKTIEQIKLHALKFQNKYK